MDKEEYLFIKGKIYYVMVKYLLVLSVSFLFFCCENEYHKKTLKNTLNVSNYSLICGSDEAYSIQGEGFSIFVYELESSEVKSFLQEGLLKSYPKKSEFRKNWYVLNWKKLPLQKQDENLYKFVLNRYGIENNKCIKDFLKDSIINKQDNFYSAIYYDENKVEPLSVDFFILDTTNNKLYFISNKT